MICLHIFQEQLSSLNSNTTSLKRSSPARNVTLSWRWTRSNPDRLWLSCECFSTLTFLFLPLCDLKVKPRCSFWISGTRSQRTLRGRSCSSSPRNHFSSTFIRRYTKTAKPRLEGRGDRVSSSRPAISKRSSVFHECEDRNRAGC